MAALLARMRERPAAATANLLIRLRLELRIALRPALPERAIACRGAGRNAEARSCPSHPALRYVRIECMPDCTCTCIYTHS